MFVYPVRTDFGEAGIPASNAASTSYSTTLDGPFVDVWAVRPGQAVDFGEQRPTGTDGGPEVGHRCTHNRRRAQNDAILNSLPLSPSSLSL